MVKPEAEKSKPIKGVQWFWLIPALLFLLWTLLPENASQTGGMTTQEQRITAALSRIQGAGETQIVIYTPESGTFGEIASPSGAVIVSQGAHDLTVQLRLMLAAQTLLDLESDCIQIFPMEEIK